MTRKAQSALEYLMTYGWAILIIVIVGAALFALGVFNPSSSSTMSMTEITTFQLVDAQISTDGNLTLILGQKAGKTVTVTSIDFTVEGTTCSMINDTVSTIITPSQEKILIPTANQSCVLTTGDRVDINPLTIQYTVAGSPLVKTETGSIIKVLVG